MIVCIPCLQTDVSKASSEDSLPPVLENIEVSPNKVNVGDLVTIKASVIDDLSGVSGITVLYKRPSDQNIEKVSLQWDTEQNLWVGTYKILTSTIAGEWKFDSINFSDKAGNWGSKVASDLNNAFELGFIVNNPSGGDTTPPVLKSINLNKSVVKAGESIKISVEAEDDLSGVSGVQIFYQVNSTRTGIGLIKDSSGSFSAELKIHEYAESGEWIITDIYLYDQVGNSSKFVSKEDFIAEFTVLNDNPSDLTPPTFKRIELNKDIGLTGNSVMAYITAEDSISGVERIQIDYINQDFEKYKYSSNAFYNKSLGKYSTELFLPNNAMKYGNWKISGIYLTDKAGNSIYVPNGKDFNAEFIIYEAPTVNYLYEGITEVTGTSGNDLTIKVMVGEKELGRAVVLSDGTFSIPIESQTPGTVLRVQAIDSAGNTSVVNEVIVKDANVKKMAGILDIITNGNREHMKLQLRIDKDLLDTLGSHTVGEITISNEKGKWSKFRLDAIKKKTDSIVDISFLLPKKIKEGVYEIKEISLTDEEDHYSFTIFNDREYLLDSFFMPSQEADSWVRENLDSLIVKSNSMKDYINLISNSYLSINDFIQQYRLALPPYAKEVQYDELLKYANKTGDPYSSDFIYLYDWWKKGLISSSETPSIPIMVYRNSPSYEDVSFATNKGIDFHIAEVLHLSPSFNDSDSKITAYITDPAGKEYRITNFHYDPEFSRFDTNFNKGGWTSTFEFPDKPVNGLWKMNRLVVENEGSTTTYRNGKEFYGGSISLVDAYELPILSQIFVNGKELKEFSSNIHQYNIKLNIRKRDVPIVTANASTPFSTVKVINTESVRGTTTTIIQVTSNKGVTNEYKIHFSGKINR
jgi:hypothetical protein